MAQASFFVNDIKVKRKGDFIFLLAQRKCIHGTVFYEICLTMPAELMHLFSDVEGAEGNKLNGNINADDLAKRFKRFSGDN
ncbi:hypothetical protein L21SP3_01672 [Sedimentisphaera cyanobacteriorum]|uniref:Uncharacterized protein n=1 Tax=Sedimentisphaera cyanobacteriorum TaxID=1940790 RepID=A0A1Q2HRK1_9BACT|nr:hypothetical protein [Sedimentisphaera cyanobacteriorum]AQQ09853.1 hypothetical protein L21SP3_01672 [Sedimentisphaera cyanobacteriorum]